MRRTIQSAALVLALSVTSYAGIMQCPIEEPTPPPPPAEQQSETVVQGPTTDGVMSTGTTAPTADGMMGDGAVATFTQVILNLLALS